MNAANLSHILSRQDRQLDSLLKQYSDGLEDLHKFLIEWLRENRPSPSARVTTVLSVEVVRGLLHRAGLPNYGHPETLRSLLGEAASAALELIPEHDALLDISPRSIEFALGDAVVELGAQAQKTTQAVTRILRDSMLAPISIKNMSLRLQSETGELKTRSMAIVQTALAQVQRQVQLQAADSFDQAEVVFAYVGPSDAVTRPFCRRLEGKAFTRKQIARLNNKQGLSAMTNGGGYRCRHRWVPISRAYAQQNSFELGTDRDIQKANSGAGRRAA